MENLEDFPFLDTDLEVDGRKVCLKIDDMLVCYDIETIKKCQNIDVIQAGKSYFLKFIYQTNSYSQLQSFIFNFQKNTNQFL